MKNVAIIPVRLDSKRLPNKALREIEGETIIQRVVNQCLKANIETHVITDSLEISSSLKNVNVIYQNIKAESGTERIVNALDYIDADNIINVQGDQPFISPKAIDEMSQYMTNNPKYEIVTAVKLHSDEKHNDSSKCKVVVSLSGRAIYFSRSPIPFGSKNVYGHLGIYGYKKIFLENYYKLKVSPLEKIEKLEQLRFIDNDIPIQTYETDYSIFSVDTEMDLIDAIKHAREIG